MFTIDVAEVTTNENNVAEVNVFYSGHKTHYMTFEDAVVSIKQKVKSEPPPFGKVIIFKIHGEGRTGYADSFGNPLPLKNWEQFAPALCEAKGWIYDEQSMKF